MARKSKVELSPHYAEIVDLLLEGYSGRSVSAYLENQYGEKISHPAITKFRNDKLNVEEAIKTQELVQKRQEELRHEEEVKKTDEKVKECREESANVQTTVQAKFINKINSGIDTLNMLREGIRHACDKDLLNDYFDDPEISKKDKVNTLVNLSKMDLDWMKSTDSYTEVNVNNNLNDLIDDELLDELLKEE